MSTVLEWVPPPKRHRYSIHALDYSVCKIGSADGWSYECWKGSEQLVVGLQTADAAKAWCQRHHDTAQERSDVHVEQARLLVG